MSQGPPGNWLPFDAAPEDAPEPERRRGSRTAPLTVRELNEWADEVLSDGIGPVWVHGELTRFTAHASGHWYFQVKDAAGKACIDAAMFRAKNAAVKFRPAAGLAVLLMGRASVYPDGGRYQLVVERMEPAGAGAAALALEELKKKLAAEGLFDAARKQPLPRLPRTIGVATSLDGAALRDVLRVLRRRFAGVHVTIAPTAVQGPTAPLEIVRALAALDARGLDVLLLVRGGGAREDLAAFDDERVVRAVAACRTPLVSGIGHEIDTTLTDHAADVRAATPSQAAELVVRERDALVERLAAGTRHMTQCMRARLDRARRRLADARGGRGFGRPERELRRMAQRLADGGRRLENALRAQLRRLADRRRELDRRLAPRTRQAALDALRRRLDGARGALPVVLRRRIGTARERLARDRAAVVALSPLAVLGRGYALVTEDGPEGRIVRDAASLTPGARVHLRVARGAAGAEVRETFPGPDAAGPDPEDPS